MKTFIAHINSFVFLVGGFLLWLSVPASAANLEFKPSIAVSEDITDNIYQDQNNKRTEFITLIQPGFTSSYQASLWRWNAAYTFGFKNFARNSGADEYNNNGELRGNITLLENFLFLDVSDRYQQILTDIARDQATQSSLNIGKTKQNTATVSPYLLWRLGEKSTLKTGYRYIDTCYWGVGNDKGEHDLFADFTHEITSRLNLFAGYSFAYEQLTPVNITTNGVSGGFRYAYADRSSIFATIGNNWQKYSNGGNATFVSWNAGIMHDFSTVLATFETSSQTTEDPLAVSTTVGTYRVKLDKELLRGVIGVSGTFTEYANTVTNANNQRTLAVAGTGRYEVSSGLTPNFSVTAEHYAQEITVGTAGILYPYHLSATTGLSYVFNHDLTLSLNYSYDTYRTELNSAAGATEINRVVVTVRKMF